MKIKIELLDLERFEDYAAELNDELMFSYEEKQEDKQNDT